MSKEILDTKVLIVGAGVAGLSLAYFLLKEGVKDIIIIDQKEKIGYPIKDTGLVSDRIFNLLPISKKIIYDKFREAEFFNGKSSFTVKAKRGYMLLIRRDLLDFEVYKKIKDKVIVLLKEKLRGIRRKENVAYTDNYIINYSVIVDATGPFSTVRRFYGIKSNRNFVYGMEAMSNINGHEIQIFLDSDFSREYFGWIIKTKDYAKIGLIDKKLNFNKFKYFLKRLRIDRYKMLYSDIIKNKPEQILAVKNFISIGESTGYLKQFSLGGVIFSIIQAKVASKIIKGYLEENKRLELYNYIIKELFSKYMLLGNFIRHILKNKVSFKFVGTLKLNYFASLLDLDFYVPK